MAETQSVRSSDLRLRLGSDQIEPVWVEAFEALSQPFQIVLDIVSTLGPIRMMDYLGKQAAIENLYQGNHLRYFHGVVVDGRFLDEQAGVGQVYRLTLRPKAHFHTRGRSFRIFQDKSVIDTVKATLDRCGIEYDVTARGGTRRRAFCVQYGESDFDFVSRLLEEDGLYYYYRHEARRHVLVICDNPTAHPKLAEPVLVFNPSTDPLSNADFGATPFVQGWTEHVSSSGEARVTLRDFDFMVPDHAVQAVATDTRMHEGDAIEYYAWPGRFYDENAGSSLSHYLLESRRAQRETYAAQTQYTGVQPGFSFTLKRHDIDRFNRAYLIIATSTSIASEHYSTGMFERGGSRARFTAIPADVQFRAPLTTPRPVASGPETAIVTGPPGEEIHVDKYGRIKVHFHWDRENPADDTSSCWIRVSQTGGLGNIILPRVGHEVLVDFINGDPDRPIVVGRVFNQAHMPLYPLPANKTIAVMRSKTYKQDSGSALGDAKDLDTKNPGASEIRFEDKQGAEELFIHAERNLTRRVRYCETHHVGKDIEIDVGKNRVEVVGSNETITIKADRTEKVEGKESVTVNGDRSVAILSNDSLDVTQKLAIHAQEINIKADTKLTITVGGSKITIDPVSIKIETIQLEMEGSATAKLNGTMTNVEGAAITTVKGGLVMIN